MTRSISSRELALIALVLAAASLIAQVVAYRLEEGANVPLLGLSIIIGLGSSARLRRLA